MEDAPKTDLIKTKITDNKDLHITLNISDFVASRRNNNNIVLPLVITRNQYILKIMLYDKT